MNTSTEITIADAVREFHSGHGNMFHQLQEGEPAVLVNLHGSFGFSYLSKLGRPPKFRGVTATQAVANALKAGRTVIFTTNKPRIQLP